MTRFTAGTRVRVTKAGPRRLLFNRHREFPLPTSATSDGRAIVFTTVADPVMGAEIWIWTTKAAPLIARQGDQAQAQLSPDGRWLAYMSNETRGSPSRQAQHVRRIEMTGLSSP